MKHDEAVKVKDIISSMCFACGHHLAMPFFYGFKQPLATIAWPSSKAEARAMRRLPIDFVRCVSCGHIYNKAFCYEDVPYSDKPNLMFNQGYAWSAFITQQLQAMQSMLPEAAVVLEIGHGDGSFLSALSNLMPKAKLIGFDPNGAAGNHQHIELRSELFVPSVHMAQLKPDIIITRHVLEHLTHPLAFLQEISYIAAQLNLPTKAYFEVPCVDRVIETGRTVDFYYEHSSQFTTRSFRSMLEKAGVETLQLGHGYDGEVVYAFVYMATGLEHFRMAEESAQYANAVGVARETIGAQLREFIAAKKAIAIWGGTGKSAAFINHYELDATRFALVVDSDAAKVGTFVPGMGQEIQFRDVLKNKAIDIIVIPPQWRAADILREMKKHHITAGQILIEHNGKLIDFERDPHPYNPPEK